MSSVILSLGHTFDKSSTFCAHTSTESRLGSNVGMWLVKLFDTVPLNASPPLDVVAAVDAIVCHKLLYQNCHLIQLLPGSWAPIQNTELRAPLPMENT